MIVYNLFTLLKKGEALKALSERPGRYYEGDENIPAGWYFTGEEAAAALQVSRTWFYKRFVKDLKAYHLPTFNRKFYLEADLGKFETLRLERKGRKG